MVDIDLSRTPWWAMGGVLFLTVVFVVYSFIGTFVFGLFIYYATRPAYKRIQARLGQRSISAALALVVFALPAIILIVYTVAIAIQEISKVQMVDIGPVMTLVEPYVNISESVRDPGELLSQNGSIETLRATVFAGLDYLGFIGNGLLHLFVMFALAFYLLRDTKRLSQWAVSHTDEMAVLTAYLRAVDKDLQNVFFGNILNAIMTGAIGAISFSLLNFVAPPGLAIPYPALTGLLAGAASLIPVVGMKLVYIPVVGYLGAKAVYIDTGLSFVVSVFLVSFVIVDSVPDFLLRPYVSGRNLHVGMVMFAYILGPLLFGWYGIFLGPIILVVCYHFTVRILPELIAQKPIRPEAVGSAYLTTGGNISPPPVPATADADSEAETGNADLDGIDTVSETPTKSNGGATPESDSEPPLETTSAEQSTGDEPTDDAGENADK